MCFIGKFTAEIAHEWARKTWQADWKPVQNVTADSHIAKKARGTCGQDVCTLADFLEDSSDDESEPEESAEGSVETPAASTASELDQFAKYLAYDVAKKDVDPLVWWRAHKFELPDLARMARQFLAAPASTAGVERAFSAVGQMHTDLRKCVSEGTIEHSMMAAMNTV